jgi:hypothetical protein
MSVRDHIHSELMRLGVHTSIAWPLSCRSDADRLALARALVPECAVVPVEPTREMLLAAPGRTNQATEESMYHGIYRAMLAAAKEAGV